MTAISTKDWQEGLYRLLPSSSPGWKREGLIDAITHALASELERMDALIDLLASNLNPVLADTLLTEWEHDFNLPDACGDRADSINRRQALLTVLTFNATANAQLVKEQAGLYGLLIELEQPSANNINLRLPPQTVARFRAGQSRCGQALVNFKTDTAFECRIKKLLPAQINLTFQYNLME